MGKEFNKIKGDAGEILAQKYLKKQKYKILDTNYKNKVGEIDIIAQKNKMLVFIEVKARETLAFGRPCEAVNLHKQNKIRACAEIYILKNKLQSVAVQFDVIEILGEQINHIQNAF